MSALYEITHYCRLSNLTKISPNILFSDKKDLPVLEPIKSHKGCKFLRLTISSDDPRTVLESWESDQLKAFRKFLEKVNCSCSIYLTPGQFLLTDETLYPLSQQVAFRRYNVHKPCHILLIISNP